MLTHKSVEGFLRVAAQKKVDGLPNEDEFVVRRLNYQRSELLGLQEAYAIPRLCWHSSTKRSNRCLNPQHSAHPR